MLISIQHYYNIIINIINVIFENLFIQFNETNVFLYFFLIIVYLCVLQKILSYGLIN